MKCHRSFIGLLMLLVISFVRADVLYVDLNDIAKFAPYIFEGKVTKVEQKWDDEGRFIYTYATVEIRKSFKNEIETDTIVIKEIGGQLDGFTTFAPSQPEYRENDNVLVFLQREADYYRTFGLNQGKFNVEIMNGRKILTRKVNVNELQILNPTIRRGDIKLSFTGQVSFFL